MERDHEGSHVPAADGLEQRVVRKRPTAGADGTAPGPAADPPAAAPRRAREPVLPWRRPAISLDGPGAPHRVRDLDRTGRAVVVAVVVLLALPFLVGLLRLERQGWMLNSDDALLGLRSLDVFSADPPLVGQPSTSETAGGGVRTYHPGPIEMWTFAPLVQVLGGWGMVVGAALVNLAAVLTAVWVAFRRLGPRGGLVAAGLAALLLRSVGTSLLTDPVSSNMWGLAAVAVAVLAWALLDGDHRLLPLLAWWSSWAAQQHLSALVPVAALVALALLGVVVPLVVARVRRRRLDLAPLRWLGAAAALALLLWSPVLVQQVTGEEGNITAVITYAGVEGRTTQGFEGALHIAVRSLDPVPVLLRTDVRGQYLSTDPGVLATVLVGAVVLLGLAAACSPGLPRRARLLLVTALTLLPAGLLNASNIPGNTVEVLRINLHRWVWPFSSFLVIGLLWGAGDLARRRLDGSPASVRLRAATTGRGPTAGVVAVALVVLLAVVPLGADDRTRDRFSSPLSASVLEVVREDVGDGDRVLLIPGGAAAELSVVPAVTFALERDGVDVVVPPRLEPYFGERGADVDDDWDAAYVVTGGDGSPPAAAGRVTADLLVDGRLAASIAVLSEALRFSEPVVNAAGAATLSLLEPIRAYGVRLKLAEADDDPVSALLDPEVVELLVNGVDGLLTDPSVVVAHQELLAERHQVWLSPRLHVLRLERGEVAALLRQQADVGAR